MKCIYSCEKFNPHNKNQIESSIIVDERDIIKSPAYLHTFEDKTFNKKYCVISDNIGIPMPYLEIKNGLFVGTSQNIYFFDGISQKNECKSLKSPCIEILISHNKIIIICECDVVLLSLVDKCVIAEFEFGDVISDYKIYQDFLLIYLMEGTEQKIDI